MQQELLQKPTKWAHIQAWISTHRKMVYVIGGIVVFLLASIATFALLYKKPVEAPKAPVITQPEPITPVVYYSPLTGTEVANEAATTQPVTAIMIENSPDARPQSGLKQAGVVYEAIAEGGITRFLALYQEAKPQLIGPVRSVRLYFVDWLAPYNASVAHVGGSLFALKEVRNGNYRDIDQFFNAGTYWRSTDRYAPHNVYTSFERLDALNKDKGYTSSNFTGFDRTDGEPASVLEATTINVGISSPTYNSAYSYDQKSNTYVRSQGGALHLDREEGQISPSTVVVMKVNMNLIMEDGYRENITTTGSGEAIIFQNGTAQTATWQKADRGSQLHFTDANGKEISLNRGQTWLTAIPVDTGSVSWQ